jgi:hypothetical protein
MKAITCFLLFALLAAVVYGGGYQLFPKLNGKVVRWSCDVIQYKVNLKNAPGKKSALRDVKKAVKIVSRASGLKFKYRGTTSELCKTASSVKSAHLVIGWHRKGASFFRGAAGIGGYNAGIITDTKGKQRASISKGCVAMNAGSKLRPGFGSAYRSTGGGGYQAYSVRGQVLIHELGHAMGLAHVNSKAEIMYPVADLSRKPVHLGSGDKKGFAVVGRKKGGCFYIPGGRK